MLHSIDSLSKRIDDFIKEIEFNETPETLYRPISYILSLGGKRIRPLLTLLAANLFSEHVDAAVKPAVAIEVFHNFTLLHDDLMDRSDMRRGNPTVHQKWNDNIAILSGDAMLIEAYRFLLDVPHILMPQILKLFSDTAMDVCRGQQYDMDFEQRAHVSESEYLEMIRLKTAVLLACSLKLGAVLGGASQSNAELLYDYGINIGLAFQLKDDLLDVFGDFQTFGKNIGDDIVNNKKTYLLIKSLELSNKSQKEELLKWIEAEKFDPQEKIKAIRTIYETLNLKQISEQLIENYYLAAASSLELVEIAESQKKELIALTENLMFREK